MNHCCCFTPGLRGIVTSSPDVLPTAPCLFFSHNKPIILQTLIVLLKIFFSARNSWKLLEIFHFCPGRSHKIICAAALSLAFIMNIIVMIIFFPPISSWNTSIVVISYLTGTGSKHVGCVRVHLCVLLTVYVVAQLPPHYSCPASGHGVLLYGWLLFLFLNDFQMKGEELWFLPTEFLDRSN